MDKASRATAYVFDSTEADHDRLIHQARLMDDFACEACLRAGLRSGHQTRDVGCGPLGVLPVLAELVGPTGAVTGIDVSATAVERARLTLTRPGLDQVRLIHADV
jgi:ubiquinone/menaquinone biosynthesis C-methylase UbiE